jgi:hypothetical protein
MYTYRLDVLQNKKIEFLTNLSLSLWKQFVPFIHYNLVVSSSSSIRVNYFLVALQKAISNYDQPLSRCCY